MPANTRMRERVHLRQTLESRGSPVSPLAPQAGPTNPGSCPGSGRAWRAAGERLYAAAATVLQNVDSCRTRTYYLYSSSGMRVKTEGLLTGHNLLMLWHNSYMLIGRLIWSCNCALLRQGQAPPGFMLRPSALFRGHHRSQHNCPSTLYQNIFLFHWTLFEAVKSGQKWKYLSLVSLSRLQFHVSALICEFHSDTARTQFGQHSRLILNNGFTQIISTFLVSSVGFRNDSGLDLAL